MDNGLSTSHALFGTYYTKKILVVCWKCQPWPPGLDLATLNVSSFGVSETPYSLLQCCSSHRKGGAGWGWRDFRTASGVRTRQVAGTLGPAQEGQSELVGTLATLHWAAESRVTGGQYQPTGALGKWVECMPPRSCLYPHLEPRGWCFCEIKS